MSGHTGLGASTDQLSFHGECGNPGARSWHNSKHNSCSSLFCLIWQNFSTKSELGNAGEQGAGGVPENSVAFIMPTEYRRMLGEELKPWINGNYAPGTWVLQQDGAAAHTAQSMQSWLLEGGWSFSNKDEWPPSSPRCGSPGLRYLGQSGGHSLQGHCS